ncbi:hypothetical protein GL263_21640 [Streptomyces durbertensis]|uniref:XRE family transcriptional regulator n=1 Tax=Streptomyces durbertensis TaxID=2448886 RepID=A0ABR6EM29_9ACTN|nr:hypothetical protein [Streptomyces durbertensis]MBB1246137.1 hypothetical protein [Streptomyces durbertensis]
MNVHNASGRRAALPADLARVLRTGPFHEALRAAITARGLALSRVRHRLAERGVRVGVTTLSYWQRGERRPARAESLRAVGALEDVLELRRGALTDLLRPTPDAAPSARPYRTLLDTAAPIAAILADLGAPSDGGVHSLCQLERVTVGRRRELLRRRSEQLLRAHRDGVDRYLAIHVGDPGCDPDRVVVRADENCRVGHVRGDRRAGVVVAELLLDARLRAGETRLIGYTVEDGTAGESREYVRGFSYPGGQYVLQVSFDPDDLPVRCHRFARSSAGAPPGDRRELVLDGRYPSVHLAEERVRDTILGISWEWAPTRRTNLSPPGGPGRR